jgi:hypothetical protein
MNKSARPCIALRVPIEASVNDTGRYAEMSGRLTPIAVSSLGEIEDHGVAFRPETNVGQVVAGILHPGRRGHSSVASRG